MSQPLIQAGRQAGRQAEWNGTRGRKDGRDEEKKGGRDGDRSETDC